jgi:RNA polymerase sigma-70 factor (ECF subfamily)
MKQSDSAVFTHLIQTHQGIVHSLCKAYFINPEDRKDAFQEVVLQLWKAYPQFRGEAKFSTWLYRIALNTILNHLKTKQNQIEYEDLSEETWLIDSPLASDLESNNLIQFILNQLNPLDKALLILYLEDYEYAEIAQILGLSLTNVSTKISRIKLKLKKIFKPQKYGY